MAQNTKIEKTEHKDKRTNIPTEETRGFVSDDEKAPKPVRYPRDPSLDPQLVWTGKDQQGQAMTLKLTPCRFTFRRRFNHKQSSRTSEQQRRRTEINSIFSTISMGLNLRSCSIFISMSRIGPTA